jgi:two-component system OmpR family sensor kinase
MYKRIGDSEFVLAIKGQAESPENNSLYFIFLVAFYLGLALVIYVWVWPLSRDLNRLEKQTRFVGKDGAAPLVELRRGSHVQMLADAFNSMSIRIKELLASRKEMTYAISHELRTPLARMKFALEMAAETQDSQHMRQQLLSVREDVDALDKFVNELLTYASFDQSNQNLEMDEGDFFAFCQSIVAVHQNENIKVEIAAADEKYEVQCDWQLMERVLTNLLQNALRYARSQIQVRLERNAEQFIVIVDDDGPGIQPAEREKAFQSFVRLEGGARVTKGYGLGLAIVKRILQWHRGNVHIEDSPLGGARFVVVWPLPA